MVVVINHYSMPHVFALGYIFSSNYILINSAIKSPPSLTFTHLHLFPAMPPFLFTKFLTNHFTTKTSTFTTLESRGPGKPNRLLSGEMVPAASILAACAWLVAANSPRSFSQLAKVINRGPPRATYLQK